MRTKIYLQYSNNQVTQNKVHTVSPSSLQSAAILTLRSAQPIVPTVANVCANGCDLFAHCETQPRPLFIMTTQPLLRIKWHLHCKQATVWCIHNWTPERRPQLWLRFSCSVINNNNNAPVLKTLSLKVNLLFVRNFSLSCPHMLDVGFQPEPSSIANRISNFFSKTTRQQK